MTERTDGVTAVRIMVVAANAAEATLRPFIQVDGRDAYSLMDATVGRGDSLTITLPDPVITAT